MRTELFVPAAALSLAASFCVTYFVLDIRSSTHKWMLFAGLSVALLVLSLFVITGGIRPFYAAFIGMSLWLVMQRMATVRQPIKGNASGADAGYNAF